MTMGGFDFAALASSSLPTVNGDSFKSNSAGGGGTSIGPSLTFLPSQPNGSINVNRIQELSSSLHRAVPTAQQSSSSNTTETKSIQDIIQERRQNILNNLFTDELEKTRNRCDELHAIRMKKDWDEQKNLYMKELVGDRRLGGSSTLTKYKSMTPSLLSSSSVQSKYLMMDHVNIIHKWSVEKNTDVTSIIYDFVRLSAKSPAYSAAWKLVYALKQGRNGSPIGRAISTLSHLGRQFQAHISNSVRSATSNGQTVHIDSSRHTGMARTVATYVSLSMGSQATHWATVYCCLRCGDFVSAKEVLNAYDPNHSLLGVLNQYARQQGSQPYYWDEATSLTQNSGGEVTFSLEDEFEKACCSLLVGNDEVIESSPVVKTIEDFIYISIWHAIFGSAQPDRSLASIGENIKKLGPRHFQGADSNDCWSYVTPLLLVQQYETSMLHLAKGNGEEGIMQATHLSLFLESTRDLEEETSSSQNLLTPLLTEFASHVKKSSISNTLLYLVRIPDSQLKRKKVVELIVDSRQFEELGGCLSQDGNRRGENAALDRHFPSKEVCNLLEEAAILAYDRNNAKDAFELLNLAERYVSLLSLLNQKLASLLKEKHGSEREFWTMASREFNNWHFNGRRTHAIEVLEAANRVDLVDVFHTLLKLFDFFNKLMMHDFENASPILEALYLFPRSNNEIAAKAQSYKSMDPILREVFPSIVLGAMDAMYQQFTRIKHSSSSANTNVHEHLRQLKNRAGLLNSFSSTLGLALDVQSKMTNMEAQMV